MSVKKNALHLAPIPGAGDAVIISAKVFCDQSCNLVVIFHDQNMRKLSGHTSHFDPISIA